MSRVLEFGGTGIDGVEQIDLHDKDIPLIDRAAFGLFFLPGGICCEDFQCTDDELAKAMQQLEQEECILCAETKTDKEFNINQLNGKIH